MREPLEAPESTAALAPGADADQALDGEVTSDYPWDPLVDGRPRRLVRGKHYRGDSKPVQRAAEAAAEEHGMVALVSKDEQAKYNYIWVQFLDGEVAWGAPCPRCGGLDFTRSHKSLVRCDSCKAKLALSEPEPVRAPEGVDGAQPAPDAEAPAKDGPRAHALGELLPTRVASPEGEDVESTPVEHSVSIETLVRCDRPNLVLHTRMVFSVGKIKAFMAQPEKPFETGGSGIARIAARLPARLLAENEYSVKVIVIMVDHRDGSAAKLVDQQAASFSAYYEDREIYYPEDGVLHPSLGWSFEHVESEAKVI